MTLFQSQFTQKAPSALLFRLDDFRLNPSRRVVGSFPTPFGTEILLAALKHQNVAVLAFERSSQTETLFREPLMRASDQLEKQELFFHNVSRSRWRPSFSSMIDVGNLGTPTIYMEHGSCAMVGVACLLVIGIPSQRSRCMEKNSKSSGLGWPSFDNLRPVWL